MNDEAISSLERLGYTSAEARFLELAALHSGYFVRRQFNNFVGCERGGADARFIDKLLRFHHAQVQNPKSNRLVYHVHCRRIYGRLDEADNRNRREKAPQTIKRKLMSLDFVLAHSMERFLATEAAKVAYFAQERGVDKGLLPCRRYPSHTSGPAVLRYFVDKLPIAASCSANAETVRFAYIDDGSESVAGFATFLHQYHPLALALGRVEFVYVANEPRWTDHAARAFARFYSESGHALNPDADDLLRYFDTRRRFELRQFAGFDAECITRLREDRQRFAGGLNETLYRRFLIEGDETLRREFADSSSITATFRLLILPHDYDVFRRLRHAS
jgi:hypothetical protein